MKPSQNSLFQPGNLVLYKSQPARVLAISEKIEIELPDGKSLKVRNKDIVLLHVGPLATLSELKRLEGEIEEACELLSGQTTNLEELAELIFGDFTPSGAWTICELLKEGLYFCGTPEALTVHTREEREAEIKKRDKKADEKEAFQGLLDRIHQRKITPEDRPALKELEDFALGSVKSSRLLKALKLGESEIHTHQLLLKLGVWDNMVNPYPARLGFPLDFSYPNLDNMQDEERLDLTHLSAFAIDDEGSTDPDDAVSIEGDMLWIHIADVASIVSPGSEADVHARGQSANLYLPERHVSMLPPDATERLGLGLSEISPALSFGVTLNEDGALRNVVIRPSLVKVERLTYGSAQQMITTTPLREIFALTEKYRKYRKSRNAVFINFPEVKIRVKAGKVVIKQIPGHDTQKLVTNAMVMAGEAAAKFGIEHNIPLPYVSQLPAEAIEHPSDLAAMFAYRKKMKPGEVKSTPAPHAGLGVDAYARATSPLRRYLDLVVHQQLRAFLNNQKTLDEQEMIDRVGAAEAVTRSVRKLERISNIHWTLVYLLQNPNWQGKGIVLENRERFSIVLIPELAMETRISSLTPLALNQELMLKIDKIDLPFLTAHFTLLT